MPSTSLSGSSSKSAASKSICDGGGYWNETRVDVGVVVQLAASRRRRSAWVASSGEVDVRRRRNRAPAALRCFIPTYASARFVVADEQRAEPAACARCAMSFSMRGTRSANTASATGRPGISLAVIGRPSVQEVPFAREDHREPELVGLFDHLLVADRTARLHHHRDARGRRGFDAVGERVERVRRARAARGPAGRLLRRDLARLAPGSAGRRRYRRPGRPSRGRSRSTSRGRRCATRARRRATLARWARAS